MMHHQCLLHHYGHKFRFCCFNLIGVLFEPGENAKRNLQPKKRYFRIIHTKSAVIFAKFIGKMYFRYYEESHQQTTFRLEKQS